LGTNVSSLRLQRWLPLELELVRKSGALCALLPRPLGLWLERGEHPPLRRGAIVLHPQSDELCVLLEDCPPGQEPKVNWVGAVSGDLLMLDGESRLRVTLTPSPGPGRGHTE
jgi:hypothetical protein